MLGIQHVWVQYIQLPLKHCMPYINIICLRHFNQTIKQIMCLVNDIYYIMHNVKSHVGQVHMYIMFIPNHLITNPQFFIIFITYHCAVLMDACTPYQADTRLFNVTHRLRRWPVLKQHWLGITWTKHSDLTTISTVTDVAKTISSEYFSLVVLEGCSKSLFKVTCRGANLSKVWFNDNNRNQKRPGRGTFTHVFKTSCSSKLKYSVDNVFK